MEMTDVPESIRKGAEVWTEFLPELQVAGQICAALGSWLPDSYESDALRRAADFLAMMIVGLDFLVSDEKMAGPTRAANATLKDLQRRLSAAMEVT